MMKGQTVLITGASSGIGKAFAFEAAKRGANRILTARSEEKLNQIATQIIRQYKNKVQVIVADLAIKGTPAFLFNQTKNIDLLINNAGIGKWTNFLDEASYEDMLALNKIQTSWYR
jgi:short-subunit dehydrogenase